MQFHHVDRELEYNGEQLSPHWIFKNFQIQGDALVSFIGPCRVDITKMVDLADVMTGDTIYSPQMLHFICEFFDENLHLMVFRQRLFIVIIKELLEEMNIPGRITRNGDDLFHTVNNRRGKLTVSIATRSITSTLMHTGINVKTEGTPVPASGLDELGIDPVSFAREVACRFAGELKGIHEARCKVKGVGMETGN
jgi:uncharacterized protein